jgi:hypothetical protein
MAVFPGPPAAGDEAHNDAFVKNFMVKTCVDGLFQLGCDFNLWIFEDDLIVEEKGDYATEMLPTLDRYINAWCEAIHTVAGYQYTPVAGVRIGEELANFTFDVACILVREDGRREEFSGNGMARLVYDGCHWSIGGICFPGFALELPPAPATAP